MWKWSINDAEKEIYVFPVAEMCEWRLNEEEDYYNKRLNPILRPLSSLLNCACVFPYRPLQKSATAIQLQFNQSTWILQHQRIVCNHVRFVGRCVRSTDFHVMKIWISTSIHNKESPIDVVAWRSPQMFYCRWTFTSTLKRSLLSNKSNKRMSSTKPVKRVAFCRIGCLKYGDTTSSYHRFTS